MGDGLGRWDMELMRDSEGRWKMMQVNGRWYGWMEDDAGKWEMVSVDGYKIS